MHRKVVDELRGTGKVFQDDSLLAQAAYAIDVYQEFPGGIPGLKELVGIVDMEALSITSLIGDKLTLELADGRRFEFYFRSARGDIVYAGGMRDASASPGLG